MIWFEPSVGMQHHPSADVVDRARIHLVADADRWPVPVADAARGQQAVRAGVRGGRAVGDATSSGTRTPSIRAAVFEVGRDAGVVLLARDRAAAAQARRSTTSLI